MGFPHNSRHALTDVDCAIGELVSGAFFFAMRSYEYTSVPNPVKTTLLRISDLKFYCKNRTVPHADPNL